MESFTGKLAVVTGGGSGMGRELVVQLAAEGCSVATCDLNEAAVAETAELARRGAPEGVRVTAHICDVSDEASVNRFRDEVVAQHETDHVNLLFNNAGIAGAGSFVADDREAWERVFGVCWEGVYYSSRAFVPLLVASEEGCLVNTASINAFWAMHGPGLPSTAYAPAKAAVKGFSEALIEDFRTNAPHVKVAVVMPGTIATDIVASSRRILGGKDPLPTRDLRASLAGMGVPTGDASDVDLERIAKIRGELFVTPASKAARIILEGVRAGRWRILVGDDAHEIDEVVRADPEGAYEPGGASLVDPDLLAAMLTLGGLFDPHADAELSGEYELRVGKRRFTCRVGERELVIARGEASAPEATLDTDPQTLRAVITKAETLEEARRRGSLNLTGDAEKVERLLAAVAIPDEK